MGYSVFSTSAQTFCGTTITNGIQYCTVDLHSITNAKIDMKTSVIKYLGNFPLHCLLTPLLPFCGNWCYHLANVLIPNVAMNNTHNKQVFT